MNFITTPRTAATDDRKEVERLQRKFTTLNEEFGRLEVRCERQHAERATTND